MAVLTLGVILLPLFPAYGGLLHHIQQLSWVSCQCTDLVGVSVQETLSQACSSTSLLSGQVWAYWARMSALSMVPVSHSASWA
jgi:hypothetical protein